MRLLRHEKTSLWKLIMSQPKGGRERGTDKASNLTLACHGCNQTKSNQSVEVFLEGDPERLKRILSQRQIPLAAAASGQCHADETVARAL